MMDNWTIKDWSLPKKLQEKQQDLTKTPATLEQVIALIKTQFDIAELVEWASEPLQSAIISAHFALGMWIRNTLVYGDGSLFAKTLENDGLNADDISSLVLKALRDDLQGHLKPLSYYLESESRFRLKIPKLLQDFD